MTIFPRSLVWDVIWELVETLNVLDYISKHIAKQDQKFGTELDHVFNSYGF